MFNKVHFNTLVFYQIKSGELTICAPTFSEPIVVTFGFNLTDVKHFQCYLQGLYTFGQQNCVPYIYIWADFSRQNRQKREKRRCNFQDNCEIFTKNLVFKRVTTVAPWPSDQVYSK